MNSDGPSRPKIAYQNEEEGPVANEKGPFMSASSQKNTVKTTPGLPASATGGVTK